MLNEKKSLMSILAENFFFHLEEDNIVIFIFLLVMIRKVVEHFQYGKKHSSSAQKCGWHVEKWKSKLASKIY